MLNLIISINVIGKGSCSHLWEQVAKFVGGPGWRVWLGVVRIIMQVSCGTIEWLRQ